MIRLSDLEDVVISNSEYSYLFSKYVKGANIKRLREAANKDQYWAERFAKLDRDIYDKAI